MDSDRQDIAESLDADKLAGDFPPERPLGVDEYGTTAAEERHDEPLEEREAREEPEATPPADPDDVEVAAQPGLDESLGGEFATELEGTVPAEEAAVRAVDDDDMV